MEDCYTYARNSFLKSIFNDFPDIQVSSVSLQLTLHPKARNASKSIPLLNAIIGTISNEPCIIDKSKVSIRITSEKEILEKYDALSDLVSIAWLYKPYCFTVNDIEITERIQIQYFFNYFAEAYGLCSYRFKSLEEIQYKYKTSKKKIKGKEEIIDVIKVDDDPLTSLSIIIQEYIEIYGRNRQIDKYDISSKEKVVVIEDSAVIDFCIYPHPWRCNTDPHFFNSEWEYPEIVIQELSYNNLYKFNFSGFKRHFEFHSVSLESCTFHGLNYYEKEIDRFDFVNQAIPQLQLKKRFEQYPGVTHHLILLRMEDITGKYCFGFAETKGTVHTYIQKLCQELEENAYKWEHLYAVSCLDINMNVDFLDAFFSWKGKRKRWRLENKFSYYYEDRDFKNDNELFTIGHAYIEEAKKGRYDHCEFGTFIKPLNRWKSEELVYKTVKKLYKEHEVIYQYKPYFLTTDKGNMSYDIYICGLKIAIEYQGKQHFEPIDYFGGMENFEKQKARDLIKARLSRENGIKLVYINYWDSITPDVIRTRIENVLNE